MREETPGIEADAPTPVVVVTGPTASGKTELAISLAVRLGGEIVNGDAMQVYRGLDIGTATPSAAQRARVAHHLFDLWDITHAASAADYQREARAVIRDIWSRGRVPLLVGGSPLYLRTVCDRLEIPPRDPRLRRELDERARREGPAGLHDELRALDPAAAEAIDPRNVRRVVRALEVVRLTGSFQARMPEPRPWRPTLWLGIDAARDVLDERIERRSRQMWSGGLLAETAELLDAGLAAAPTAAGAVGYRQAMSVLAGERTPAEGLADTIRATRRLARRQQRTLRGDPRIQWVTAPGEVEQALDILRGARLSAAGGSTPSPAEH